MGKYKREELEEALQIVFSTINRCEKHSPNLWKVPLSTHSLRIG